MSIQVLPKGNDRTWTREFYRTINRVARLIEYEHRDEMKAELIKRMTNFYMYGTTHPEAYALTENAPL